jgi:hypothetical protein
MTKPLLLIVFIGIFLIATIGNTNAQGIPSAEENIPHLVTFGKNAEKSWGDDDFCQVLFFVIPKSYNKPVYIRVFDPDIGGEIDEQKGTFDTKTKFTVYGGKGCISDDDARKIDPTGNYKSGELLASKSFGVDPKYDQKWYSFGPFNPSDGEYMPNYGGNVFKIIAQGVDGDDGNLYKYFLSVVSNDNKPVEGGNAFTFEYTFRLSEDARQISHLYPFIDDKVISVKQSNFDWDDDGYIRVISADKQSKLMKPSGDNNWASSQYQIRKEEKNKSQDVQFIKDRTKNIKNNNVVFHMTNQYGEALPFFSIPIGGKPKYNYSIGVRSK